MSRCRLLAIALMALSITSWSVAQEGGRRGREGRGGGRGRGGPSFGGFGGFRIDKMMLAGSEQVQKELKVSEEQKGTIGKVVASYREKSRELFPRGGRGGPGGRGGRGGRDGGDVSREEREKQRAETEKKRDKLRQEAEKKLAGILDKKQVKRLDEIALQQRGIDALTDANVAAALHLSKEQIEQIKKAVQSGRDKRGELFRGGFGGGRGRGGPGGGARGGRGGGEGRGGGARGGRGGFGEIREKMEKIQKETETAVLASLTGEQKKKFASMKGKKFELDRRSLFGGSRGGRGRGGEGRGGRGGGERRRPPVDTDA